MPALPAIPVSGRLAVVNGIASTRRWLVNVSADENAWHDNSTQGGTGRTCGNEDWNGYYLGYGDTPSVFPGDLFTFTGDQGNNYGVVGDALCTAIEITCDVEANKNLEYQVEFIRFGAITLGAAVGVAGTVAAVNCAKQNYVKIDSVKFTNTRYWKLRLSIDPDRYADSESAGGYLYLPGPVDAEWMFRVYIADPSTLPEVNDLPMIDFGVTPSPYTSWQVKYGKVLAVRDLGADRENKQRRIVGAEVHGKLAAISGTTIGWIKNPASVTKWPV